jgi:hypothetical protein
VPSSFTDTPVRRSWVPARGTERGRLSKPSLAPQVWLPRRLRDDRPWFGLGTVIRCAAGGAGPACHAGGRGFESSAASETTCIYQSFSCAAARPRRPVQLGWRPVRNLRLTGAFRDAPTQRTDEQVRHREDRPRERYKGRNGGERHNHEPDQCETRHDQRDQHDRQNDGARDPFEPIAHGPTSGRTAAARGTVSLGSGFAERDRRNGRDAHGAPVGQLRRQCPRPAAAAASAAATTAGNSNMTTRSTGVLKPASCQPNRPRP